MLVEPCVLAERAAIDTPLVPHAHGLDPSLEAEPVHRPRGHVAAAKPYGIGNLPYKLP